MYIFACVYIYIYIYIYIYLSNLSTRVGCDTRSNFKQSLTSLNSELFFFLTGYHANIRDTNFTNYLSTARERIVIVLCEMLTALSRIWTWAAMSISYDDCHYTTSMHIYRYRYKYRYMRNWNLTSFHNNLINKSFIY